MSDWEITRKNAAIAAFFLCMAMRGREESFVVSGSVESVPAPATLFLLGVGLLSIAAARRRQ